MAYRCGICDNPQRPGTRAHSMVLDTRDRVYEKRKEANEYTAKPEPDERKGKRMLKDDPGGRGWEIVREAKACAKCAGVSLD